MLRWNQVRHNKTINISSRDNDWCGKELVQELEKKEGRGEWCEMRGQRQVTPHGTCRPD